MSQEFTPLTVFVKGWTLGGDCYAINFLEKLIQLYIRSEGNENLITCVPIRNITRPSTEESKGYLEITIRERPRIQDGGEGEEGKIPRAILTEALREKKLDDLRVTGVKLLSQLKHEEELRWLRVGTLASYVRSLEGRLHAAADTASGSMEWQVISALLKTVNKVMDEDCSVLKLVRLAIKDRGNFKCPQTAIVE